MKTVCLSKGLVPLILPVLTDDVQVVTQVSPALRNLYLEGPRTFPASFVQEVVEPFVAVRQVLGNPVVFREW